MVSKLPITDDYVNSRERGGDREQAGAGASVKIPSIGGGVAAKQNLTVGEIGLPIIDENAINVAAEVSEEEENVIDEILGLNKEEMEEKMEEVDEDDETETEEGESIPSQAFENSEEKSMKGIDALTERKTPQRFDEDEDSDEQSLFE
ncbi:unnamed protein product, partial [Strongylus vulgaris]